MFMLSAIVSAAWRYARPALGWLCLSLGVLGVLLPVLPGAPLLVLGVALVGRRAWLLRWATANGRLALRRWAARPHSPLSPLARHALRAQYQLKRRLRPRT
jgi:hypothetical protein